MKKLIPILKKIFITVFIAGLLSVLFFNIATLWSVDKIKHGKSVKSGYFCAIIGSGSMEPTILVNDLLFIKGSDSYKVGDIITYVSKRGTLVTHRVIEVSDDGYITQGDANNIPDEKILAQNVLGRVVSIMPGVGAVVYRILSPAGLVLLGGFVLLIRLIQGIRREQNEVEDK